MWKTILEHLRALRAQRDQYLEALIDLVEAITHEMDVPDDSDRLDVAIMQAEAAIKRWSAVNRD